MVLVYARGRRDWNTPACHASCVGIPETQIKACNIGALTITYTILVVPYYIYSIAGLKTLF